MALIVKDRVQETSTTTGTGTLTLAGAVTGFQSFSVIGNANTTYYAIVMDSSFEIGIGTYTLSGTTLSRTTVLESSNAGALVNFSAGTKSVFCTYPAEQGLYLDASGNAIALGTPASATLTNATGLPISTGVSGLGAGVATFLATPSSANLISAVTNETGTGSLVFATSPTLVTPILGTPTSGTATNLTGLPLTTGVTGTLPIANGGTGTTSTTFTNLTTNVTGTLPVANGGTGVTASTGTVAVVLSTSPTLVTPVLGVATATSVNKVALTAPATSATLTIADGKTLTASNTLTLAGTDATTMTFPASNATVAGLGIVQTFTAAQRGTITALTDGATITPDFAATNNYSVTLGGNRTLANPTNITAGQSGSIFVSQDGTGSRTLAYGTNWDFAGGTAPTLSTAASSVDRIDYVVRTATSIHAVFTAAYS